MEELKEKLKSEVEQADWDMLRVHHQRNSIIMIMGNLELLDVAVAVAMDKTDFVKLWLDNGDIARPTEKQVFDFEKHPFQKICDFVIISPYVLIKLLIPIT